MHIVKKVNNSVATLDLENVGDGVYSGYLEISIEGAKVLYTDDLYVSTFENFKSVVDYAKTESTCTSYREGNFLECASSDELKALAQIVLEAKNRF